MTAQISDLFRYNDSDFSACEMSHGDLFTPSTFGMTPIATCTACWRGYQAVFAILQSRLVLDSLHVSLLDEEKENSLIEGPTIHGVKPTLRKEADDWFNNEYDGLNYQLHYTGGVLIGDVFIDDLYEHMGFHPAWKYRIVHELVFADGILQQAFDRSELMAELRVEVAATRKDGDDSYMHVNQVIREFMARSFDQNYGW